MDFKTKYLPICKSMLKLYEVLVQIVQDQTQQILPKNCSIKSKLDVTQDSYALISAKMFLTLWWNIGSNCQDKTLSINQVITVSSCFFQFCVLFAQKVSSLPENKTKKHVRRILNNKNHKNNFFIILHQSAEKVVQKRNITQLRWEVAFWLEGKSLKSIFCLLPDLAFFVLSKVSVFFASLSIGFFTKAFRSTTWFLQSVPLQKQTENLVFCHSSGHYCQCLFPFQLHEEKTAFSKFNARVANVQYYFFSLPDGCYCSPSFVA